MLQFSGHHIAYNITYNAPFVSATPCFLGTEPPDYHSTGTDLNNSSSSAAENAYVVGTDTVNSTTYKGDFLVSYPFDASSTTTYVRTAAAASTLTARTNVTATAISGATSTSYTISSPALADTRPKQSADQPGSSF